MQDATAFWELGNLKLALPHCFSRTSFVFVRVQRLLLLGVLKTASPRAGVEGVAGLVTITVY